MISIIQENLRPKKTTFLDRLGSGIYEAGQMSGQIIPQLLQQREQEKLAQEQQLKGSESLQNLLGIDLSALSPEMQKAFGQEILKLRGKGALQQEKLGFLEQLFTPQGTEQVEMTASGGFNPADIPDEAILKAAAIDPNLARELRAAKDSQERRSFEREKYARQESRDINVPIEKELMQVRKNIPLQRQAIEDIKSAAPNVGTRDYIADLFNFEPLRTAEGTKLKTAVKDFFLSDLTRVGARPNQWIEQQLADALPKIGREPLSNLITAAGLDFKVDLAEKRAEVLDRLAEEDREKYGYVRADREKRAYQEMKPYVSERQKELEKEIRKLKSTPLKAKETLKVRVQGPDGSIYEIDSTDVEEATNYGFRVL